MNNINNNSIAAISWKAEVGHYRKKGINWYWIFWTTIGFILFLIYFFTQNEAGLDRSSIVLMVLVAISGLTVTMASIVQPKARVFRISQDEIFSGTKIIPMTNFESYKIDLEHRELFLKKTSKFQPLLVLPLSPIVNLRKMKDILDQTLKYDDQLKTPQLEKNIEKGLGI